MALHCVVVCYPLQRNPTLLTATLDTCNRLVRPSGPRSLTPHLKSTRFIALDALLFAMACPSGEPLLVLTPGLGDPLVLTPGIRKRAGPAAVQL